MPWLSHKRDKMTTARLRRNLSVFLSYFNLNYDNEFSP